MNDDIFGAWRGEPRRPEPPVFTSLDPFLADSATSAEFTHEELAVEVQRLRHEKARMTEAVRRLRAQNAQLRQRLVDQNSTSCDTTTLDNAQHTILADRYRDLVQQDFQHVVRQRVRGRSSPRRIAAEIRALCQELLTGDHSATGTCIRLGMDPVTHGALVGELTKKVRSLTDQIPTGVWDFDAVIGGYLDPDTQQPWGQCESHHPIRFVVAPAYRTNGRIYARQLVFAGPKSHWRT
jgi:regulator of replication initiation timing